MRMPTKGTKLHEIIIPGKAFEYALQNMPATSATMALSVGEKRKKGRGYRVFAQFKEEQAQELAKFYGSIDVASLSLVDAQAIKNAKDRFYAATGTEHKPDPRVVARREEKAALAALKAKNKTVENRGRQMREKTAKEIWSLIFPRIAPNHCSCELKPGMDLEALKALGSGCTDPHDYKYKVLKMQKPARLTEQDRLVALSNYPGHVCPVLDTYRRAVEKLNPPKKVENE